MKIQILILLFTSNVLLGQWSLDVKINKISYPDRKNEIYPSNQGSQLHLIRNRNTVLNSFFISIHKYISKNSRLGISAGYLHQDIRNNYWLKNNSITSAVTKSRNLLFDIEYYYRFNIHKKLNLELGSGFGSLIPFENYGYGNISLQAPNTSPLTNFSFNYYFKNNFYVPLGLELNYKIGNSFAFLIDAEYIRTFNDYFNSTMIIYDNETSNLIKHSKNTLFKYGLGIRYTFYSKEQKLDQFIENNFKKK